MVKLVRENIEFKRGQDPKRVLDIGRKKALNDPYILAKTMIEEIVIIENMILQSIGDGSNIFVVNYDKEYSRPKVSFTIYNWLKKNTKWRLKDLSNLAWGIDCWWNIILINKEN